MPVNLGEPQTVTIGAWLAQIVRAAGADLEFITVPDHALPAELALTAAPAQHLLASVQRAKDLLGWSPGDAEQRVADSVRWHLANPSERPWTEADASADDTALNSA